MSLRPPRRNLRVPIPAVIQASAPESRNDKNLFHMTAYDVFNGDADGICSLQQLRLHSPKESILVTGLKREIDLLSRIEVDAGDDITVLDISMDKNREALDRVLEAGASVFYADHHYSGDIPEHDRLEAHIDVAVDTCTSLIVNQFLENAQAKWAVVGTFGDNFDTQAGDLGQAVGLKPEQLADLQQLGICLNYNGYGFDLDDLLYHPRELFSLVHPYQDPLEFVENEAGYTELLGQYRDDMARSTNLSADSVTASGAVFMLPNESWARRIVGVLGNDLAKRFPDRAHALLVDMGDGNHRVSVRAPYHNKQGADDLCRQFNSGGGRKAAAGINQLEQSLLPWFIDQFNLQFGNSNEHT